MGKASTAERLRRRRQVAAFDLECGECGATFKPTDIHEGPGGDSFWYSGRCACGNVTQGCVGDDASLREFVAFVSGFQMGAGYGVPQGRWYERAADWFDHGPADSTPRH
jgi:hypothetical protein